MKTFKNLDIAFYELNRECLLDPDNNIEYTQNIQGFKDNQIIKINEPTCTLDLADFGYKKGKWAHLLRTYIDWEQLVEFKEKLATSKSMSLTYYFKQKQVNNGSCLLSVVFTRKSRKGPWTKMNMMWRTTELNRRFAADCVLLYHFIKELPECCQIDELILYFNQMYCNAMFINGYLDYFDVDIKKLKSDHDWIQALKSNHRRFFKSKDQLNNYKALQKMQNMYFGLEDFPPIPIESLGIEKHFRR